MIREILRVIYTFITNALKALFDFLSRLLGFLFQKLIDFLKILLYPILFLVALLLYIFEKIAQVAVELFKVIFGISMVFVALIRGIFTTLAGFSYQTSTPSHGQWTSIFQNVAEGFGHFQLDTIAYILLFIVWFCTAFIGLRIITSMRGGG